MNYESRRITISYLAVIELCKMFDLPQDAPTQALSAGVEKLIFQGGVTFPTSTKAQLHTSYTQTSIQPNKAGLANMVGQFKGLES